MLKAVVTWAVCSSTTGDGRPQDGRWLAAPRQIWGPNTGDGRLCQGRWVPPLPWEMGGNKTGDGRMAAPRQIWGPTTGDGRLCMGDGCPQHGRFVAAPSKGIWLHHGRQDTAEKGMGLSVPFIECWFGVLVCIYFHSKPSFSAYANQYMPIGICK